MPNLIAICAEAGATIEEATGEINVKAETTIVMTHFSR